MDARRKGEVKKKTVGEEGRMCKEEVENKKTQKLNLMQERVKIN